MNRPKASLEADLRLREALRFVAENTRQAAATSTLLAGAMVFLLRHSIELSAALVWLSVLVVIGILRMWQRGRVRKALAMQRARPRHLTQFTALAFATGAIWASAVWTLRPGDDRALHAVVLLACAAIATGGAFASVASLRTAFAIFWPPMLALVAYGAFDQEGFYLIVAVVAVSLSLVLARLLLALNHQFVEQIELREYNAELVLALQRRTADAEAANEAKSRFLLAASHDLRQPMHAIAIRSRALLEQDLSTRSRALAERLDQSVAAMQSLFDALLDISRLDAGSVQPSVTPMALQPLLDTLRDSYADGASQRRIQLEILPTTAWVHSDALLLERILRQLLDNALQHAGPCRVTVQAIAVDEEGLAVEVRDTGKGMTAEQQAHIFKDFVQLENPERDRRKGLGLGLAIVERIARQLDHRIELLSDSGVGTCFRVFLPSAAPVADPLRASDTLQGLRATDEGALKAAPDDSDGPSCIALLDDDPDVLEATSALLSQWQYEVIAATHSPELIRALETRARAPDLLICDYRLAEKLNGLEVINHLRQCYGNTLPSLLITGDLRALDGASAIGDIIVLRKPVAPSTLRDLVEKLIDTRQPRHD